MSQEEIAVMFRKSELERRVARRKRLINELKLTFEQLDPEDRKNHEAAIKALQEANLTFEKESSPGYWKRLWCALWNK